ncbi:AAA-ATPase At2g46620-like [Olea europaea subsp. europaea]|uniref:AAA-ATPase At2g46620-like n=1 Tax=Olea europaea subsp. europaea TaxID=158383 RepID=A0A8S0QKA4_OLEEU|nr:AAA-ATPase At2g46620-like [Olea europaea subsp. europaea]
MFLSNPALILYAIAILFTTFRLISRTCLIHCLKKWGRSLEDKCYVYQSYKVPKFNGNMQENQLHRQVYTYLNSLPCVEDSDFANLFSGNKSTEINIILDENQVIVDNFLGARVYWINEKCERTGLQSLILKIRKKDKRRILVPYMQHIHTVFDEIEQKKKEVRLFVNAESELQRNERWRSVPFTHPATMETVVMDADLKTKIKSDMETFLKSKQYYQRLGRVWKRSYLLYGPAGTGKSTFIAAMAKFLSYDIYEIDLNKVANYSNLKNLLLQTSNKSLIVIEDLDQYLGKTSAAVNLSGILNFMDGISSEERIMVFTMSSKENIDQNILRPGRIDVHIHFPLCDFSAFKTLASSHLGLKDHKLFSQVEENFLIGASLSPAEIGEIMISNRSSPSRALKTVISALQSNVASRVTRKLSGSGSGREIEELYESGKESQNGSVQPMKELKNLYGFLRKSGRKSSMDLLDVGERDNSNHGN